ncbi:type IV toxin-antitoxin system AbiEi family antitoxin domain-containing protein [Thermodesulfobacteriota bacterium]
MKNNPIDIFRQAGGQLRMSEAIAAGISRYTLYRLRDQQFIEPLSRGIYRLAELPPISNPDLITVSLRYPKAVVCLLSALSFHGLTTQIPHKLSIAVSRNSRIPSLDYPPLGAHRFAGEAYEAGIEKHEIDGITIRVYDPEKTIADCFKFRNKLGMDVVLEALKYYGARKKRNSDLLMKYGRICRVGRIMKPYLEAIL